MILRAARGSLGLGGEARREERREAVLSERAGVKALGLVAR